MKNIIIYSLVIFLFGCNENNSTVIEQEPSEKIVKKEPTIYREHLLNKIENFTEFIDSNKFYGDFPSLFVLVDMVKENDSCFVKLIVTNMCLTDSVKGYEMVNSRLTAFFGKTISCGETIIDPSAFHFNDDDKKIFEEYESKLIMNFEPYMRKYYISAEDKLISISEGFF